LTYQRSRSGPSLTATCSDISVRIARNPWRTAQTIASGAALATGLATLLRDRYSRIQVGFTATSVPETLAAPVYFTDSGGGSDPWGDLCKLAADHGYALYIDADGVAQMLLVPDPATAPLAYTYRPGATAIITDQTRVVPLARIYNGVVVTGEGSGIGTPVCGEAWDENPASPTYRCGPFGEVGLPIISSVVTTVAQAQAVAAARLTLLLGRVEELSWSQIVNPALKPFDVVGVADAAGVVTRYVIDQVTTPLTLDAVQTAVTRSAIE